jgi:hypothetical protein
MEQEKVNQTRMWGYAIGALVFAAVVAWKFITR